MLCRTNTCRDTSTALTARTSEPHEKLPWSRRSARNLELPPRTRTRRTHTLEDSLVMAGWRPSSYLRAAAAAARWSSGKAGSTGGGKHATQCRRVAQAPSWGQRRCRRPSCVLPNCVCRQLSALPPGAECCCTCARAPPVAEKEPAGVAGRLTSASCAMPSACRPWRGACAGNHGRYLQQGRSNGRSQTPAAWRQQRLAAAPAASKTQPGAAARRRRRQPSLRCRGPGARGAAPGTPGASCSRSRAPQHAGPPRRMQQRAACHGRLPGRAAGPPLQLPATSIGLAAPRAGQGPRGRPAAPTPRCRRSPMMPALLTQASLQTSV